MKTYPFYCGLLALLLLLVCAASPFAMIGCAPKTVNVTPPVAAPTTTTGTTAKPISATDLALIQTGAAVATGAVLNFAEPDPAKRTTLANQIYSGAHGIWTFSAGQVPTPSDFNTGLALYGINGVSQYTQFTTAISSIYAEEYAKYQAGSIDQANLLAVVNALAAGAEAGAKAYVTIPTAAVASSWRDYRGGSVALQEALSGKTRLAVQKRQSDLERQLQREQICAASATRFKIPVGIRPRDGWLCSDNVY